MGSLLPGEVIVYERVDGTVYGKYRDRPDIPRWVVGYSTPTLMSYNDWKDVFKLADENPVFDKELQKLITLYYLLKK